MMRNPLLLAGRHLVGPDVEAPIDGRRIARDDLAVEAARQRDCERAFPGGGRTDDGDEGRACQSQNRRAIA
jgi:hypothetical protein